MLGWLLHVLDFRRRSFSEQVLLSTPLSLAVCPIATYLVELSASIGAVWFVYGCCWALFPVVLVFQARGFRSSELRVSRYTWIALGIVAAWCLVILLSLVDLQIHDRLYSSVAANDYGVSCPDHASTGAERPAGIQSILLSGPRGSAALPLFLDASLQSSSEIVRHSCAPRHVGSHAVVRYRIDVDDPAVFEILFRTTGKPAAANRDRHVSVGRSPGWTSSPLPRTL